MIEFACHTWGFNDQPLATALGTVARLGFRYVDLGSGPHLDVVAATAEPGKTADTYRELLETFNLRVSDLYIMLPRISVADDDRRQHEIMSFERLMPFAAKLGVPGITVSPGVHKQGPPGEVVPRVAEVLGQFVAMAGERGIALSFEPHLDSVTQTPEHALDLLNRVDDLMLTLDWAHLAKQGLKPDAALHLLPHLRHVQVRQAAPLRMQTPFEQGVLDLDRVMTLLMSTGYNGVIAVESLLTLGWHGAAAVDPVAEALQLRDALRALRDKYTA
jgi:sugar phosphate isomerase/epimerase